MDLQIAGRVALITGAAGGVGRAVAEALGDEGAALALLDRAAPRALADDLRARGVDAHAFAADATDDAQAAAAVDAAVTRFGGIDLVAGCAGISGPVGTRLEDTLPDQWDEVFAVNVRGSYLLLRHTLPLLRGRARAAVVLVASDSALVASGGMAPYCASKAAVVQLARAASVENPGVRINAICPSIIDTPMSRGDLELADGFDEVAYPVQSAAEVASTVAYLLSPRARPVDAAALVSDFGYTARSGFPA
ncbi:MAG: SDR family oxidoreductase [Microbacterium sp.]|uniref:SDR family NAD(P)-dependent oxidoreductase n=1 Tax=Microbacterium sp. TaxID=51671 RepID=UPI001AD545E5|nr:SDR family oxidoreductase [Microbacterium sp.]MBN9178656.1 SDR family oxidoreductase [Microbacterium sp.]